jgi:hypothetical protein
LSEVAYEYPNDFESQPFAEKQTSSLSDEAATIAGAEDMSDHLRKIVVDYTSAPESRKLKLLSLFLDRILKISSGESSCP